MARRKARIPYTDEELFSHGTQRVFTGEALREIAFPLGGIGTGCISLGGRGELRDWEIFNRPNQGFRPPFAFAALRAQASDGGVVSRVVESPILPPFSGPGGAAHANAEGLPHMASNTFRGEYPFAWLRFQDDAMPLAVSLEAFNPFIPLNEFDSGLPVAVLVYRLENVAAEPAEGVLTWSAQNVAGYAGSGPLRKADLGGNRNVFRSGNGINAIIMDSTKHAADSPRFGSMALATLWPQVTYTGDIGGKGGAFDTGHLFWDALDRAGGFDNRDLPEPSPEGQTATCVLGARVHLGPGQAAEVPFLIAWHFPNYVKYWGEPKGDESRGQPQWRNYYATRFADAWEVAQYVGQNLARLRAASLKYHDALFGSTLPAVVLDAASSQASTLKTPTCLRLEDGTFYGFEGCSPTSGCCPGSCTHVWNYQQALPFLFPALERSMRTADYAYNLRESDGKMAFRIELPLGTSHWDFHAAADGQLGGIIKTYRDWLICGDDEWLRRLWPRVKKSLSYVWEQWDLDRDGLLEGVQHNTYDIELQGPNPLTGAFYLGALRAAEEMARRLGDIQEADDYRRLFEEARSKLDKELFNGEYYVQKHDPARASTQQFGDGCLSDQMLGQWLAGMCGLGYLLEPDHVRSALLSIFRHNWKPDLSDHPNPQRIYAVGHEAGLLMCSWPRGNRPLIPTMYCDEVWTGIEYQVASHLIEEGFVREGLAIVKGARDRHDGRKRNPWDEPECGSHYARAMSSWGLILALSGYHCCTAEGLMQFAPRMRQHDFRTFWSHGSAWGTYWQKADGDQAEAGLSVLYGQQELRVLRLGLPGAFERAEARLGCSSIASTTAAQDGFVEVRFDSPLRMSAGEELLVRLAPAPYSSR
jgi:uncharacterized protein (DUF608 family)